MLKVGIEAASTGRVRNIKLSGREAAVIRAIGFAEPVLGADIHDQSYMELDDVAETVNGLLAAGFVESIPFRDQVDLAEFPTVAFEINPAYTLGLRSAMYRR